MNDSDKIQNPPPQKVTNWFNIYWRETIFNNPELIALLEYMEKNWSVWLLNEGEYQIHFYEEETGIQFIRKTSKTETEAQRLGVDANDFRQAELLSLLVVSIHKYRNETKESKP